MDFLRITVYVLSLGGALLIFLFRNRMTPAFLATGWFLLFAGLSQLAAFLLIQVNGSNIVFYNSTLLVHYALLYAVLINLLKLPPYRRKINAVFFAGLIGVCLFLIEAYTDHFASRSLTIINFVVIAGSLLFFYNLLKIPDNLAITRQGKFWIGAALLVYHIASFTLWLMYELMSQVENSQIHALMGYILTIIHYSLLVIATIVQINNFHYAERK